MTRKLNPREARQQREQRILTLAGRQHGLVTRAQLNRFGLGASGIDARLKAGRLHVVHRGVFALGRPDLPKHGRWMAAVLACGEGALLSHRSASALHELLGVGGGPIDVTVPNRSARSRPGIRVHRPVALHPSELTAVEGIPCTSVARTLLDLAAVVPIGVLESACNRAEVLNFLDMAAMGEVLGALPGSPGRQGTEQRPAGRPRRGRSEKRARAALPSALSPSCPTQPQRERMDPPGR
jgi:Transcriptional regulator, AbiEi antitoxin